MGPGFGLGLGLGLDLLISKLSFWRARALMCTCVYLCVLVCTYVYLVGVSGCSCVSVLAC